MSSPYASKADKARLVFSLGNDDIQEQVENFLYAHSSEKELENKEHIKETISEIASQIDYL